MVLAWAAVCPVAQAQTLLRYGGDAAFAPFESLNARLQRMAERVAKAVTPRMTTAIAAQSGAMSAAISVVCAMCMEPPEPVSGSADEAPV